MVVIPFAAAGGYGLECATRYAMVAGLRLTSLVRGRIAGTRRTPLRRRRNGESTEGAQNPGGFSLVHSRAELNAYQHAREREISSLGRPSASKNHDIKVVVIDRSEES